MLCFLFVLNAMFITQLFSPHAPNLLGLEIPESLLVCHLLSVVVM